MPTVYAPMEDRLLVATDASGEWTVRDSLRDHRLESVAAGTGRPERVLVGTFEAGLQRSTDGGETFERVGEGVVESDAVTALAVSPHDPDVVWAGTEPSAVYRSTDGGRTWAATADVTELPSSSRWSFPPRPHTHHVRWIEPDPQERDRLYVGVEAGAFLRTDDGGDSWQDHPTGARRDNHTLATHRDAPGLVYTAAGDGFAVSRDGGDTWSYPQEGLAHHYCWSVVVDPADPARLVMSAATGARWAHFPRSAESYVYRRHGDGPWERVEDDGLPTGEGVLRAELATTGESSEIYAANNRGVFHSTDGGKSWRALDLDWPAECETETVRGLAVLP